MLVYVLPQLLPDGLSVQREPGVKIKYCVWGLRTSVRAVAGGPPRYDSPRYCLWFSEANDEALADGELFGALLQV